jgi:hypothetical protein
VRRGEDSLYEPVSPTPLPDSPVDEVRQHRDQVQYLPHSPPSSFIGTSFLIFVI